MSSPPVNAMNIVVFGRWHTQAADFKRAFGGNVPMGPVTVVLELEEEEDFWEYFILG
jgi:hypothetical protein